MFTGFEPMQVQQYTKVKAAFPHSNIQCVVRLKLRLVRTLKLLLKHICSLSCYLNVSPSFLLQRLHALGGELADSSQKVTHLVASKVTRTVKFLTAMSVVKHIVTPEWLEESWRSQKFVGMFASHPSFFLSNCVL